MNMGGTKDGAMGGGMEAMMMPAVWTLGYAAIMFFMWWIMMLAMMLPSASPMILLYAALHRRRSDVLSPIAPTGSFAGGYAIAWAAFSVAAVFS